MSIRRHFRLFVFVTIAWLVFWIAGLPNYYKQYATIVMIAFDVVVLLPIWWVGYRSIRKSKDAIRGSLWLAFYFTVPLFIYDFLYCGYYLGYDINFISEFWYLSVYYMLPWLIFPPTGWWIDKQRKQSRQMANEQTRNAGEKNAK